MKGILNDGNGGWRKVPISVFMTVTVGLLGVICSLVSWNWAGHVEREAIAKALGDQFEKQAQLAVRTAETNFRDSSERMSRIQGELNLLRSDFTRHVDTSTVNIERKR